MSLWFGLAPSGATLAVAGRADDFARLRDFFLRFFFTHLPRLRVRPFLHFFTHLPFTRRCFEVHFFFGFAAGGAAAAFGVVSHW